MNHLNHYNKNEQVSVFKKWSRKGYAIFGSLGHVVHIGRLSVALLQCIGQLVLHIETVLQEALAALDEDEVEDQELLELELIAVVNSTDVLADVNNKIDDILNRQWACPVGGFLIFKTYDTRD